MENKLICFMCKKNEGSSIFRPSKDCENDIGMCTKCCPDDERFLLICRYLVNKAIEILQNEN